MRDAQVLDTPSRFLVERLKTLGLKQLRLLRRVSTKPGGIN